MRKLMTAAVAGAVFAGVALAEDKIVCEGSSTVGPLAKAFAEHFMKENPGVNVTVSESGSSNGAKAIVAGECDVANLSRAMKDAEAFEAKKNGINVVPHIVALDGLAVVVHRSNPVAKLTRDQVRDIFTGKIANWKDVGGLDAEIVVVSRDTSSGTFEAFAELVLGKGNKTTTKAETVGSNGAVRSRVEGTKNAVGYVGLGFVEGVKPLLVNDVEPTEETVLDNSYPVSRPLFMYTDGEPKAGSMLEKFVNFYKTDAGIKITREIGFVPSAIKPAK